MSDFRPRGIRVDRARSYVDLDAAGEKLRGALNLQPGDEFPAAKIFESLDSWPISGGFALEYAMQTLPPPVEAETTFVRRGRMRITLSEETYEKLQENDPRARFTFAHELMHVVLHSKEIVRLAAMPHALGLARGGTHKPFHDSEWQADGGAAAFLMPVLALATMESEGRLETTAVMREFKVSQKAANYRLDNYRKRKGQLLHLH